MPDRHRQNVVSRPSLALATRITDDVFFLPGQSVRLPDTESAVFFSVDDRFVYEPFFLDFGPLHIGHVYRFCEAIPRLVAKNPDRVLYFYTNAAPQFIANGAVLVGAYQIIVLQRTPEEAYSALAPFEPFLPFRDAASGPLTFPLTVKDCLNGIFKGFRHSLIDFSTFDPNEYEFFECVENGDLNIIVKGKFLAFSGPHSTTLDENGFPCFTPEHYVRLFKRYGVTAIVRLNKKCYRRERFSRHGFTHHDLFFLDGTTPTDKIVDRFLDICDESKGMIAIHCKAGLGRTGTLLGCYLMKKYKMTAEEAIAWIRLCRPGSIIGPQQHFLRRQQQRMWGLPMRSRSKSRSRNPSKPSSHPLDMVPWQNDQSHRSSQDEAEEKAQSVQLSKIPLDKTPKGLGARRKAMLLLHPPPRSR